MKKILTLTISAFLAGIAIFTPAPSRASEDFTLTNQIIEQAKLELQRGNFGEAEKLTRRLSRVAKTTADLFRQADKEAERRADRRANGWGRELELDDRRQAENQIKGAEQRKAVALRAAGTRNVTIPADILNKADNLLARGKTELSAGNFKGAERSSRAAKNIFNVARADIANLGKMRDDFEIEVERHEIESEIEDELEDRINRREGEIKDRLGEKRTKVQAEVAGNVARARVEVQFGTNATNQNAIAQEILNRMKLTRDDISRLLVIQNRASMDPEDLRERFEVKTRVSTSRGEAEARLRFSLSTVDRSQIIDGIFARTQALTVQDILEVMEFKNDSDKNNKVAIKGGEIKVTAETLASGSTLAKVEVKFGSALTDKNAIAQEMANRMKLSKDEISRLLVVRPAGAESLSEKLEAKSAVKNKASENEAMLRTPLSTNDRNQIIDGIFQRLQSLSVQDILNVLNFRTN